MYPKDLVSNRNISNILEEAPLCATNVNLAGSEHKLWDSRDRENKPRIPADVRSEQKLLNTDGNIQPSSQAENG